jgi:predicted GIY-YIG superfamily endonuclease
MSFHVYILRGASSGKFYVGHAQYPEKRIAEHHHNRVPSTKNRGPWQLVYTEQFPTRAAASCREREIKAMKSHAWIEQLAGASR